MQCNDKLLGREHRQNFKSIPSVYVKRRKPNNSNEATKKMRKNTINSENVAAVNNETKFNYLKDINKNHKTYKQKFQ